MTATTSTPSTRPGRVRGRAALAVVLAAAAVLSGWNAAAVGFAPYYAAGAISGSRAISALVFGTVDPAATLTLDKLSGFLLPQSLSVAVFGVHAWSLALPQVAEGLVTVWAGYRIGVRWKDRTHGLVLAGLLALTPILVATDGRPTEDAMVAMCGALAFAAVFAAVQEDRPGLLVLAGAWVGVGFQAKMLAAWLVLPALLVTAVLGRPPQARRWRAGIAAALLVCVLISLAWPAVVAALPETARPFIDGTSDDDPFSMVLGYNGLDRLLPHAVPGALPQLHGAQPFANATRTGTAGESPLKLLLPRLTTQIGWLYPTALVGAVVALAAAWRRARQRPVRSEDAATVGLAVWLLVSATALSAAFMPHASYLAIIATPIAAFAARGLLRAIAAYRADGTGRLSAALPILVVLQTVWAASVLARSAPQVRPSPSCSRSPRRPRASRWSSCVVADRARRGRPSRSRSSSCCCRR
ncbi:ArnT family glycosyltransferase [Amnibacterium kyonggiense]